MQYAQQRSSGSNAIGIGLVVVLHLGVGYALIHALVIHPTKVAAPLEAVVIVDKPKIIEPPPPPTQTQIEHPILNFRPEVELKLLPPPLPVPSQTVTTTPPPTHELAVVTPAQPPALADTHAGAKRIAGPSLQYPRRPLAAQEEGWVDVQCNVDDMGGTSNCAPTGHQGSIAFVDAAMDYVKATRYSPATHNGAPVAERDHRFHIEFKLSDR